jgi:protein involved in polysaccharide export with SLBB domain
MKTTPLILFFILLVVLVMSIVFSRYLPLKNTQEGLIGVNPEGSNHVDDIYLPFYDGNSSRKVTQVHDSIYFDQKNGNLIEVFVKTTNEPGNSTVQSLTVKERSGKNNTYSSDASGSTNSSKISSVSSSFNKFFYVSDTTSTNVNPDKYLVLYISYNTDTILYVFKDTITSGKHKYTLLKSALFNSGYTKTITDWSKLQLKSTSTDSRFTYNNIDLTRNSPIDTSKEDKLISGEKIDIDLYMFNRTSFMDIKTGDLYLIEYGSNGATGDSKIFDRTGTLLTSYIRSSTPTQKVANSPWAIMDSDNNLIIVYPYSTKTVVSILRGNDANGNIEPRNVVYFKDDHTVDGLAPFDISGPSSSGTPLPQRNSASSGATGTCGPTDYQCLFNNLMKQWFPNGSNNVDMMYELWLPYFNSLVSAGTSNDYMLKTQIVPPVCPSCPSCNCDGGVCSSCGGNGGSGTNTDNKKKGATGATGTYDYNSTTDKILNDHKDNHQDGDSRFHGPGVGGTISNVTGDVTGLVGSTVGTAGSIVNNAVNTAGGLLYSAGSGAVNLLKSGGQSQTGPVGLNYQTQQPGVQQRDQYYSQGQTNTPIDNYSQYGALQSRAGNYMPMTADFSRFGK